MKYRIYLLFILCSLLTACSSTTQLYWKTLKSLVTTPDYTRTFEETLASKIYLAEIVHGKRAAVTVALAYVEGGKRKWVASDQVVLTTQFDQLVATTGLKNDLDYLDNVADWSLVLKSGKPAPYSTLRDIEDISYQTPAHVTMEVVGNESFTHWGHEITGIKVLQTITEDADSPYWELGQTWTNVYILDPNTHQVLYQAVKVSAKTELLKVTYTSRVARLLAAKGVDK